VPSSNRGRLALVGGADIFDADLIPTADPLSPLAGIVADYYWGAGVTEANAPVEIPYSWVSIPVQRRPTNVINSARVTSASGTVGAYADAASVDRYGEQFQPLDIDTACTADPANLATFLVTYYAQPRPRQPRLVLNLYNRSEPECNRILGVGLGERVHITGAPAGWPPGVQNFTVEGIHHVGAVDRRIVEWSTSAIVGTTATEPGPWFRLDASVLSGTDLRPY
jgi:hypothetical protein